MTASDNSPSLHERALAAILLAAVLWSLGGVLIKSVSWHPAAIAGARSAIAAAVLWLLFPRLRFTLSVNELGGAVAYAATVLLFVIATKLTTAANAIFLQYTAPVYVALFSRWFLNERVTRLDVVTIVFTLGGMGLFFLDRLTWSGVWGNVAAITSGVAFAWTCLFLRRQGNATAEPLFLGNVLTALLGLPFMTGPGPGLEGWLLLAGLGVWQLGVSYALFAYAVKYLPALEVILISSIEPILNPIWVMIFIGELPGPWALAGGLVVLASVTGKGVMSVSGVRLQVTAAATAWHPEPPGEGT